MAGSSDLDRLLDEAERQPFSGWDFSWLTGRTRVRPLPWDFDARVVEQARLSPDLLDMGTGGGERLSRLSSRPARTVATEAWPPNVPIAAGRLNLLGIPVVQVEPARDNPSQGTGPRPAPAPDAERDEGSGRQVEQPVGRREARLPFLASSFHLVDNRHESFVASEVARILVPGGHFLTQQVGHPWSDDFYDLLGLPLPPASSRRWDLSLAVTQVEAAGLEVLTAAEGHEQREFLDIGALAWYLKAIRWTVPDFTIERFRPRLAELHGHIQADGPLVVSIPHFWLAARKP